MVQIRENISLRGLNTFGVEASARYFTSFHAPEELQEIIAWSKTRQIHHTMVLGGGSNILLMGDVDGLVLHNQVMGIEVVEEKDDAVYVKVGAGVPWHQLVVYSLEHNLAGLENLALIPGNTGASPMQNIGAYGVEIKDVFHSLQAFHIRDGEEHTFSLNDCRFGYRESVFKHALKGVYVITSVTFRLRKVPVFHIEYGAIKEELEKMKVTELSIRAIADAVIRIRQSKLPNPESLGNAGSFFKNPVIEKTLFDQLKKGYPAMPSFAAEANQVKIPAGWLIEQCGWKGYRKGDAGCYEKQALVLVNYGSASGQEIYELSSEIIRSVHQKFGVQLEREVNVIGKNLLNL